MQPEEKAVNFAAAMIRKGDYPGRAVSVAANYYKVPVEKVRSGLSARSGRSQAGKKKAPRPVRMCQECQEREATNKCTIYWGYNQAAVYTCDTCGQHIPSWYELGSGHETPSSMKWTRYTPTRQKGAGNG
jgi:hypothetical protein